MADLRRTIEIILSGSDRTGQAFSSASRGLETLERRASSVTQPLTAAGSSVIALSAAAAGVGSIFLSMSEQIDNANRRIAASLGIPFDKAEELGGIAQNLFGSGLVDSVEEGADAIIAAFQKFGDVGEEELQKIADKGLEIQNVFGSEYTENIAAAETLTKNFGITNEQAFDFIVSGFQKGLNSSGDFLESINEYSTQFSNGGASAEQFFSLMESGLQSGVLGTDKAADAFKEFRVRIQDGSKATKEALEQLGIDSDALAKKMANGSLSTAEAFQLVLTKLQQTDDRTIRMQAGVGLLGTQYEDLGGKAVLALDITKTSMDDLAGASAKLEGVNQSLSKKFTQAWRTAQIEVAKLKLFEEPRAEMSAFLDALRKNLPKSLEGVDFSAFQTALDDIQKSLSSALNIDLSSPEGLRRVIQAVTNTITALINTLSGIAAGFSPFIQLAGQVIGLYTSLDSETQKYIGTLLGMAAGINTMLPILGGMGAAFGAVGTAMSVVGDIERMKTAFTALQATLAPFAPVLAVVAAGFAGWQLGRWAAENIPAVKEIQNSLTDLYDTLLDTDDINAARASTEQMTTLIENLTEKTGDATITAENYRKKFREWVDSQRDAEKSTKDLSKATGDLANKTNDVGLAADKMKNTNNQFGETVNANTDALTGMADNASKAGEFIEKTHGSLSSLSNNQKVKLIEAKIKLNVSQIEADVEKTKAAFDSLNTTLETSASVMGDAFGALSGANSKDLDFTERRKIFEVLESEMEIRQGASEKQAELIDAYIEQMKARSSALMSGESLITINAEDLQPSAKAFMMELLDEIKIEANAAGQEYLLGMQALSTTGV